MSQNNVMQENVCHFYCRGGAYWRCLYLSGQVVDGCDNPTVARLCGRQGSIQIDTNCVEGRIRTRNGLQKAGKSSCRALAVLARRAGANLLSNTRREARPKVAAPDSVIGLGQGAQRFWHLDTLQRLTCGQWSGNCAGKLFD